MGSLLIVAALLPEGRNKDGSAQVLSLVKTPPYLETGINTTGDTIILPFLRDLS